MATFLGREGGTTYIRKNNTEMNLTANYLAPFGILSLHLIEEISEQTIPEQSKVLTQVS